MIGKAKVSPLKSRSLSLRQALRHKVCLCSVTDMVEIQASKAAELRNKGWFNSLRVNTIGHALLVGFIN